MMSQSISPNRLSFSRDFLLQYQHIYKPDPTIEDKVTIYVVTPRSTQLQESKVIDSPHQRTKLSNEQAHPDKNQKVQKPREGQSFFPSSFKSRTTGLSATTGNSENSEPIFPSRWSNLQSLSAGPSPLKSQKGSVPRLTLPSTTPASPRTTHIPHRSLKHDNIPPPSNTDDPLGNPLIPGSYTSRATSSDSLSSSPSRLRSMSDPASSLTPPEQTSPQKSTTTTPLKFKVPDTPTSALKKHSGVGVVTPFRSNKTTPRKVGTGTMGHPGSPSGRLITPIDDQRLVQRKKQIDYGYRTVGYVRYRLMVPKERRKPEHPRTPKRGQNCSKRSWDGQLKKWRRDLHLWDPNNLDAFKSLLHDEMAIIAVLNPELTDIVKSVYQKLEDPSLILEDEESDTDDTDSPSSPRTSRVDSPQTAPPQKSTNEGPRLETKVARTLIY